MIVKTAKLVRSMLLGLPLVFAPTASVVVMDAVGIDTAAFKANAQDQRQTRKTPALSQTAYKKLAVPQLMMNPEDENEQPDFQGALVELKKIEAKDAAKWNAYELANLYNSFGFAYYSLEDYDQAIKYYKLLVAQSPSIPLGLETGTLYTIAQLQFVQEDFAGALATLRQWFKQQDPMFINADNYALLSTACYQVKDFDCALKEIRTAIKMYQDKGELPKENWWSIEMAIEYDRGNNDAVVKILETLVRHYPKVSYWKQLSGLYGVTKQEDKGMYLSDATYVAGKMDKETEVLNVAYMFLGEGYAYRAAKIIDKGLKDKIVEPTSKNLETLATAWRLAMEIDKSIAVMKEAAAKSDKGNLYAILAGNYVDSDQNKEALDAGEKAIARGGVKRMDQLHIVMGMANANLGNWDACLKSFKEAKKDKRSEAFAKNWMQFCEGEKKRERSLAGR